MLPACRAEETNSMTARSSGFFPLIGAAAALWLAGCSERHATPVSSTTNEAAATLEAQSASVPEEDASQDVIKAALPLGNVAATYRASFEEGQLKRIAEERKPQGAAARRGQYVFYGARLIEYSGAALQSDATLELHFDMQGGLMSATGSAGKPDDIELSAIRNRAQLLRSHALARKSTRGHGTR
jgi:hypothetical protein